MGLFDFLKKGKETTTSSSVGGATGGTSSVFKGDLAMVQDVKKDPPNSAGPAYNAKPPSSDNKDSAVSVVFMTFSGYAKIAWHCPECGTASDGSYDGCVVCGFKR